MDKDVKDIFDFFKTTIYTDNTPDEIVWQKSQQAVKDMLAEQHYTQVKRLYRFAGQSGSGKTTQLLPTITKLEELRGNKPFVLAVRNFAKYHPQFNELLATFGKSEIRKQTDGFALKCLSAAYKQLMEKGILMIDEMGTSDPEFESYKTKIIQDNDYTTEYHIMAVNQKLSNLFIEKREKDTTSPEGGRAAWKEMQDRRYNILPTGIDHLGKIDTKSQCFVWTAYDKKPIYQGKLNGATQAIETGRKLFKQSTHSEETLRNAKLQHLLSLENTMDK